jgi:hypothetical protein
MWYLSFEDQVNTIAIHAWEQWTKNGLGLDEDTSNQTMKTVNDIVNNEWVEGISEVEWLNRSVLTLKQLTEA